MAEERAQGHIGYAGAILFFNSSVGIVMAIAAGSLVAGAQSGMA